MEIDFDASDKVADFVTVPAGTYLCRVAEVRPGTTRAGDERWSLRLVVAEGHHVGKQAAWDSLVFSPRGRARAQLVFAALGLPAHGRVQVDAADLEGREAFVQVRPAEYTSPSGETIRRNEVPYDGYRAAESGRRVADADGQAAGGATSVAGDDPEQRGPATASRRRPRRSETTDADPAPGAATDDVPF